MNPESQLFPTFDGDLQANLYKFTIFLSDATANCLIYDAYISVIGLILNFIHLIVLTRKSMTKSSSNTLMIGLAVSDIGLMIISISIYYSYYWDDGDDYLCKGPNTYWILTLINVRTVMDGFFRRCSTWMVITMATIRTVPIKIERSSVKFNARLKINANSQSGWIFILSTCLLSSLIAVIHWSTHDIVLVTEGKIWSPPDFCEGFPENYTRQAVNFKINSFFMTFYSILSAVTSKIIPCIALPILTTLLLSHYKSGTKQIQQRLNNTNEKYPDRGERATKLVIYITVMFMIAELPQGICTLLDAFPFENYGFTFLTSSVNDMFVLVGFINIASQGLVCYAMSSEYRKTFKEVFSCKRKTHPGSKPSVITVAIVS